MLLPACAGEFTGIDTVGFVGAFVAAVVSGVAGILTGNSGIVFTPLMMGFTSVDPFIVRATGLVMTLVGAITVLIFLWIKGLVNVRLIIVAAVPYIVFSWFGDLFVN